jgi:hypothetical protein
MSSKKTFELAAEEIKFQVSTMDYDFSLEDRKVVKERLIAAFIVIFTHENPRFDKQRFIDACEGSFSPTRYDKLIKR